MEGKGGRSVPFPPPAGRSGDVPDSSPFRAPAPPAIAPAPRAGEEETRTSVTNSQDTSQKTRKAWGPVGGSIG